MMSYYEKGHVRGSLSPVVPALLTPRRDDSWRMCVDSIEIPIARLDMKGDPVSSRNSPL